MSAEEEIIVVKVQKRRHPALKKGLQREDFDVFPAKESFDKVKLKKTYVLKHES